MSLHVQFIAKKFGAVKLIHSHLSFLCCLVLNPVINRGVSVFFPHFCRTLHRLAKEWWDRQWPWLHDMHSQVWLPSCVSIQLLETTKLQKFPLSYQGFRQLANQKMEMLINLNLLIYLGLKMSCGAQPKSFFVSSSVMCETTLISFLRECRQVSLFGCCMGIFIPIV